ncbi:MAG: cyanophycinase [bacterium]|nr:cyanophycinase [bacterium]
MTRLIALVIAVSCIAAVAARGGDPTPGPVIAVGGGGTPEAVFVRALELAGSNRAVVVIPHASLSENRGEATVGAWRKAGARRVTNLDGKVDLASKRARALIESAGIVWFPGGSQVRLCAALEEAKLTALIAERHLAGVVVGGTSAGAAAISEVMISGAPEPAAFHVGAMRPHKGLGLVPWAIVDQHFIERGRNSRLLTAVLDHPRRLGVGISERTAIITNADGFEVLGEGPVVVYDASQAEISGGKVGEPRGARGVVIDVLRSGDQFER